MDDVHPTVPRLARSVRVPSPGRLPARGFKCPMHASVCTFLAPIRPGRDPRSRGFPPSMSRMDNAPEFTPLVLLVDDQEWTSRSIESILRPKGHVVLKAYTGQQAIELVTKVNPDAVIVDVHL